jgi:hypothetical protein
MSKPNGNGINGHSVSLPKNGPLVRAWEPDDHDLPAAQFEFRLLECGVHGVKSHFRRHKQPGRHECLGCYVERRREVYVRAEAGKRVVVETMQRDVISSVDVPFVPPLRALEVRLQVPAGKRLVIETFERREVASVEVPAEPTPEAEPEAEPTTDEHAR